MLTTVLSIIVGGMLGHAVDAGYHGRLAQYINSPQSYAIALFSPESVQKGKGGWQGEHAGKWLYTASKAYERTGDPAVLDRLTSVADYLLSLQEENGYLGCYREDKRYYHRPSPEAMTVDWDTWIIAYLIKGLTETTVATGNAKYADAALRLTEFLHWTVFDQGIKIAQTGQHSGMAGCGMLDPLCDLYLLRPTAKVKEMIDRCIQELDETPCLQLVSLLEKGYDVALIGNGKIYEMTRCLTGLAKAYQLFGDKRLLVACNNFWNSVTSSHLTTLGGPWGGINFCWELFNRAAEWAPYEVTETCSVMEWMHFNWEMLRITGDGKFASEIEKTSYNALMAARAEDGLRWIYYVRTNGELTPRGDWACCWSSGMTALEDIPCYMYETRKSGIYVNIIEESAYTAEVKGRKVRIDQTADYALTGKASFVLGTGAAMKPENEKAEKLGSFEIAVHLPQWASSYTVKVNGKETDGKVKNGYITLKRSWKEGDVLDLEFPYTLRSIEKTWEYRNAGSKEHNFSNWYNGFTKHYVSYMAGPLVFATDHLDRFEKQSPIAVSRDEAAKAELLLSEDGKAQAVKVGGTTLRPICLMPPFEGEQARFIWFQLK
ncbi:MAG: glycoside hydrolase family 127 protein [Bacteroidales bacterium]|nr:glycoside hydrolase family 127 protein [Bacteroidales bacterium]